MHVYIFAIFLSKNCFYSRNRASLNFAILFGTALSLSFSLSWRVRQLYLCSCSSSNFCPIVLQLCVVGALYLFFSQNKAGARGRFMLCCFLSFFHFIFCSYMLSFAVELKVIMTSSKPPLLLETALILYECFV